jgi:hypothetical protein
VLAAVVTAAVRAVIKPSQPEIPDPEHPPVG